MNLKISEVKFTKSGKFWLSKPSELFIPFSQYQLMVLPVLWADFLGNLDVSGTQQSFGLFSDLISEEMQS